MARTDNVMRKVVCPNPHCGNTIYEKTYSWDADVKNPKPIWKCTNCGAETPRTGRARRSNRMRTLDAWKAITEEWRPITDALFQLYTERKINYGLYLLHNHMDNYHVKQLMNIEKPRNWDVAYHANGARADLEKAKLALKSAKENN